MKRSDERKNLYLWEIIKFYKICAQEISVQGIKENYVPSFIYNKFYNKYNIYINTIYSFFIETTSNKCKTGLCTVCQLQQHDGNIHPQMISRLNK